MDKKAIIISTILLIIGFFFPFAMFFEFIYYGVRWLVTFTFSPMKNLIQIAFFGGTFVFIYKYKK